MSNFIQTTSDIDVATVPLPWLKDLSSAAKVVWQKQQMPSRKTEDWKYTSLRSLEQGDYAKSYLTDDDSFHESLKDEPCLDLLKVLDGYKIVFVNGHYSSVLSSLPSAAETNNVCVFSSANSDQKAIIGKHLNSVVDTEKHVFSSLNALTLNDGVLLHLNDNQVLDKPVHIVSLTTRKDQDFSLGHRLLVVMGKHSQGTVIEHFVSTGESQNSFVNAITEFAIGENAQLNHYRLHEEQEDIIHIGGVHANLGKSSVLNSFQLALGSTVKRIDVVVNHCGEGAHCELKGVYLPRNKQHVDFHTCIEHAVPHCTTNEVFRGIISDSARAVFNGRIHIHKYAQKTYAQLSNKNLLTSNKAEVDTKPELEIYADDVLCAHGATIAQLDTESLHYFKTRGISTEEAMVMLSFGFINELVDDVKLEAISMYLRPKLAALFAVRPELTRHIA